MRFGIGEYNKIMKIPNSVRVDIDWWVQKIFQSYESLDKQDFSLTIFSDASLTGWGIVCGEDKVSGLWSEQQEKLMHINILKLKEAFFWLKCFANDRRNCSILLRIDNTTAISYINKMGGVRYHMLNNLAREIWQWCELRNINILASYIKSCDNTEADAQSRKLLPDTEWELNEYPSKKSRRGLVRPS
ncbi:hypothetical protein NQ315_006019 [Exocentrus adspersus]|uniref:RNase H type-1 domain-containing protein n=1 Tax=Exocentrus adspersus TaxID=1586481 RepID=A0AAV8V7M9_9CUCU|nr:hypothetical protein NQ315_006019 [Exocentrus adspersus]